MGPGSDAVARYLGKVHKVGERRRLSPSRLSTDTVNVARGNHARRAHRGNGVRRGPSPRPHSVCCERRKVRRPQGISVAVGAIEAVSEPPRCVARRNKDSRRIRCGSDPLPYARRINGREPDSAARRDIRFGTPRFVVPSDAVDVRGPADAGFRIDWNRVGRCGLPCPKAAVRKNFRVKACRQIVPCIIANPSHTVKVPGNGGAPLPTHILRVSTRFLAPPGDIPRGRNVGTVHLIPRSSAGIHSSNAVNFRRVASALLPRHPDSPSTLKRVRCRAPPHRRAGRLWRRKHRVGDDTSDRNHRDHCESDHVLGKSHAESHCDTVSWGS